MAGAILVLSPIYAIVHLIVGIATGVFYAAGRETYNQRATKCQKAPPIGPYCFLKDVLCTQQLAADVTLENPCVPQENYPYKSYGEPLLSEATAGTMGVSLTVVWLQIVNDFSMALVTTIVIWSLVGPARKHAAKTCRVGTLCHLNRNLHPHRVRHRCACAERCVVHRLHCMERSRTRRLQSVRWTNV